MKEAALEVLPIKALVSLNGGIGLEVLDVREPLARSKASIKCDMDLWSSAINSVEMIVKEHKNRVRGCLQISRASTRISFPV